MADNGSPAKRRAQEPDRALLSLTTVRPGGIGALIDVTKLSTPLLRMLQAELQQIQQRQSQTVAAVPSPTLGSAQEPPPDDAARGPAQVRLHDPYAGVKCT
jgi:hypothetical protein